MKAKNGLTRRIATVSMLTTLSLITFLIENLFPPLIIPGAKLGLANAFSFAALIIYGPIDAFAVVVVRSLLGAIFAGNVSAIMYSFTGGIAAMSVSALLMYLVYPGVSITAVSVLSAVIHNLTQNAVFAVIAGSSFVFVYAPYLAMIGVVSGAVVGTVITLLFKKIPIRQFAKILPDGKV